MPLKIMFADLIDAATDASSPNVILLWLCFGGIIGTICGLIFYFVKPHAH